MKNKTTKNKTTKNKTTQTLTCEAKPSDSKVGKLWEVIPIVSGLSANNVYYPADVLEEHYDRINWANSYLYALEDGSFEHLPEDFYLKQDRDFIGNLVGWLENPRVETSEGKTKVIANWYIHKAAKSVREFLLDCWEHGKKITLSVTCLVDSSKKAFNGKMVDWVNDIYFVSADPVSFPAVKGAEVQTLLASDNQKGEILMDTKLKEAIKSLVKDIAPEADIPDGDMFDQSQAVALLSQTMETLDIESFPEETLKKKLGRARKEIENNNFDSAFEILKRITSETESEPDNNRNLADSNPVPADNESTDSPTVSDKNDSNEPSLKQRLIAKFGKEKAEELLELFGDDAYKVLLRLENDQLEILSTLSPKSSEIEPDCKEEMIANFGEDTSKALFNALGKDACNCLPNRSPKIEQDDYMTKLGTVYELLDAKDTDAALKLLSALLAGNYGYPYPSPQPAPKSEFFDKLGSVYELIEIEDLERAMPLLSALIEGEYGYPSEEEGSPYTSPEKEAPPPAELKAPSPEELPSPEEVTSPEELPTPEEITAALNKELQAFEEQLSSKPKKGDDSMKKDNDVDYRKAKSDSSGSPDSMKKDNDDSKESAENRITRIELEKLLESSVLPEPAAKKILCEFKGQEATRDEMIDAIQTELEYLESLDVKPQEHLKTEAEKTSLKLESELKKLRKKQETELEKIKAESKTALSELKRQKKVNATKEVLNQLLEDSGLNSVSEQKIRKKFEGEVASKKEIEKAIDEEMDLTAEIINEIASTVTGFGKLETESTNNANSIIHDWFGKQFSIPKSDN